MAYITATITTTFAREPSAVPTAPSRTPADEIAKIPSDFWKGVFVVVGILLSLSFAYAFWRRRDKRKEREYFLLHERNAGTQAQGVGEAQPTTNPQVSSNEVPQPGGQPANTSRADFGLGGPSSPNNADTTANQPNGFAVAPPPAPTPELATLNTLPGPVSAPAKPSRKARVKAWFFKDSTTLNTNTGADRNVGHFFKENLKLVGWWPES